MPTRRKSSLAVWWLLLKGSKIINVLEALLLLKLMRFTVLTIKCSCVTYFVSFNDNFRFWSACIKLDLAISNYGDLCKKKKKNPYPIGNVWSWDSFSILDWETLIQRKFYANTKQSFHPLSLRSCISQVNQLTMCLVFFWGRKSSL